MNDIHFRGWTASNRRDLELAGSSLPKMLDVALDVTERLHRDIGGLHFFAGAISTGGVGNVRDNLRVFMGTIEHSYRTEHFNIFSQMPFEVGMIKFHQEWGATQPPGTYCQPILDEFYAPLFATRRFVMFHFMHGYLSSNGARWEHGQAMHYRLKKRYLSRALSLMIRRELGIGARTVDPKLVH